jgi:hypothetical protein
MDIQKLLKTAQKPRNLALILGTVAAVVIVARVAQKRAAQRKDTAPGAPSMTPGGNA